MTCRVTSGAGHTAEPKRSVGRRAPRILEVVDGRIARRLRPEELERAS
jgi:hypothetical protein